MTRWLLALAAVGCIGCEPTAPPPDPTAAVESMLASSAASWNAGDLDGFVDDYLRDAATSFMAARGPEYGFDWIREAYAPRFTDGARRDSLRFETIRARPLGGEYALATGRYVLSRGDSVTSSGPFTLVLVRTATGWKIVHDHTHSDPE